MLGIVFTQKPHCGTTMPDYNFWLDYMTEDELNSLEKVELRASIPLDIYIVYDSSIDYLGLSLDSVFTSLNDAQYLLDLNEVGIELEYNEQSIRYINNADHPQYYFYPLQGGDIVDLTGLLIDNAKLKIIFTDFGESVPAICGGSLGVLSNLIFINNKCTLNNSTLVHEIGHNYGLFHTHENNYVENVPRNGDHVCFNCNISGDYLCDTNADPGLYSEEYPDEYNEDEMNVNSGCVYFGEETNECFPYSFNYEDVDTRNIMSYSYSSCRDHFTDSQVAIMQFFAGINDIPNEIIDVEFKNRINGEPDSNLGGLLKVYNEDVEYVVESGEDIPLIVGNQINVFTMGIDANEVKRFHLQWNGNLANYKRNLLNFEVFNIFTNVGLNADYEEKISFTFQSEPQIPNAYKFIRDPWWYDDESDEQPNILKPLFDFGETNSYSVFAKINYEFSDDKPIYSTKVPKYIVNHNEIYEFDTWTGELVIFNDGDSSDELETEIVFTNDNAELIANYSLLNISPNFTLKINTDELFVITENSYLNFPEGFKIIVDGGTIVSEEGVTMTSTSGWQGIKVRENSKIYMSSTTISNAESIELWYQTDETTISNCTFENTGYVISVEGSPHFINCTFKNNQVGLVTVSMSHPVTIPKIENCIFENNEIAGMLSGYRSQPVLFGNTFINNSKGLSVSYGSQPFLFTNNQSCETQNNLFDENEIGVYVSNSGLPWLGIKLDNMSAFEGYNRFASNSWDVYSENTDYPIYAQMNHWQLDSNNPCESGEADVFGEVYWHPTITENNGSNIAHLAFQNEVLGDYIIAASQYIALVMENPDAGIVRWAIAGLSRCYTKLNKRADLITLLEQIMQDYPETLTFQYASTHRITQLIDAGNYEEALNQILILEGLYPESELTPKHLFEEWIIAEKTGGLSRGGKSKSNIENKLIKEYAHDDFGMTMAFMRGIIPQTLDTNTESIKSNVSLTESYSLSYAYPNPFNPATVIKYALPKTSMVTIGIYDILGREITTLVNTEQSTGTHQINWDASQLASGMYLIRFTTHEYQAVQKITLSK